MKKSDKFKLHGYILSDSVRKFGFMIPIFSKLGEKQGIYLQIADESSKGIHSFAMIENLDEGDFEIANQDIVTCINNPLIYAFKDRNCNISCGTLPEITPCLRIFLDIEKTESAVNLQIAELVGTSEERDHTRNKMLKAINDPTSRSLFERSLLILAMHNHLSTAYKSDKQLGELFVNRSRIKFKIESGSSIQISFDKASSNSAAAKYNEILSAHLVDELKSLRRGLTENDLFESEAPLIPQSLDYHLAFNKIKNARNQEERIALILYYILAEREIGKYLLSTYRTDRAQFANSALNLIRETFSFKEESLIAEDLRASALISVLFRKAVFFNRGRLILYLAQYLSRYPNVNLAIEKIVSSSNSYYIDEVRREVERILLSHRPLGRTQQFIAPSIIQKAPELP